MSAERYSSCPERTISSRTPRLAAARTVIQCLHAPELVRRRPASALMPRLHEPASLRRLSAPAFLRRLVLAGALAAPVLGLGVARSAAAQTAAPGPEVDLDRVVAQLEPEIARMMVEGNVPSATVALVAGERVLWAGGYGYANLWARTPAVPSTVYLIGSTFKAMSTVALLQQMEEGRFRLDDPVDRYLTDFGMRGQDPERSVTFQHLLTHTSGLPVAFGPVPVWGDSAPPPLEDYLRRDLEVVGPPLDSVRYSNLAYSLVAYLVQSFAGVPFKQHIQERIFEPLEMRSTAFAPTPEMEERLAVPYLIDRHTGRPAAAVRLKAAVWPAGIVYGTVLDQANWLILNLNGGVFKGRRLIRPETLHRMHTIQFPQFAAPSDDFGGAVAGYGLTWRVTHRRGERLFAHTGSVPGYTALIVGNLDRRIGIAIMTNGHRAHPHLYRLADRALELIKANTAPTS